MRQPTHSSGELARIALVLPLVAFLAAGPAVAYAHPTLQEVVSGEVVMQDSSVDVTNGSIANYGSFDIHAGDSFDVNFTDGGGGNHLARVPNGLETQIMGSLTSNGHVYLANPAGILIGPGGRIDMAGFHAAAGDVKLSGLRGFGARPEGEPIDGQNEYQNLTGSVRNLGTINAAVVDLVGRYVENAGIITFDPGDALNGYYVLAAGEDVIIGRQNEGSTITLTISGLAPAVLEAIGATEVGVALTSTSKVLAEEGGVSIGAEIKLGAGDLFGTAIHFAGASNTRAQKLAVSARGGNLVLGDETGDAATPPAVLAASQITLCAGELCDGVAVPAEEAQRAAILVPVAATLQLVAPADPDGDDDVLGTEDDNAARLEMRSDDTLGFDFGFVDPDALADFDLSSGTGVTLAGVIEAREFRASASDREALGLPRLRGDVVLAEGVSIDAETILLEGITVEGVPGAVFVSTDVRTGVDEELSILNGLDLVIDDAYADAISELDADGDPDLAATRRLTVSSFRGLEVTASQLSAREIVLEAGRFVFGGDLQIGAAGENEAVRLSADSVTLSAAATRIPLELQAPSSVVIHDNATLSDRDGTRLTDFKMIQEAAIDVDSLPSVEQLGGSGVGDYSRAFVSEAGTVTFGEVEAELLMGPADPVSGAYTDSDLSLTLDSALGTVVTTDLEMRELTIGRGVLRQGNIVIGDLTTTGNLGIFGPTRLDDLVGETAPQRFESREGSVTLQRILKRQGSLEIAAGGPGENPPIRLEGDIEIANGNLDIQSGFSWLSESLEVSGDAGVDSEDGIDRGVLTIRGPDDPGQTFQSSFDRSGTQTLDARVIAIERGVVIEKHEGSLDMIASNVDFDTLIDDPTATIDVDGVIRLVPDEEAADQGRALEILAGGAVTLGDSAHLVADRITIVAARSGQTDQGQTALQVGEGLSATSMARLHADNLGLEAGSLDAGGEDDQGTTVSVAAGVEFRDATGLNAPLDLIIRQAAPIAPDDLPSLSQFGLASLQDGSDAMIYQVEAAKSGMLIDAGLAAAVLDGTAQERARIDLRLVARDEMRLVAGAAAEADLNAALVLLAAGSGGSGDLSIDAGAAIHADTIQFDAGNGAGGPSGARVVLSPGDPIELRGTLGTTGPEVFVFSQDASIGGDTRVPSVPDSFGDLPEGGTEYVLRSRAGTVTLGVAQVETGDVGGPIDVAGVDPLRLGLDGGRDIALTVRAAQDVELIESISADRVVLVGDQVLVGLDRFSLDEDPGKTVTGVVVAADEIEFNAEGAVQVADSARFTDTAGGDLPQSFALRQGDAIGDANLPLLGQFGASPAGDLTGMRYEIASAGAISLTEASRIEGSDLVLVSARLVTLDTGPSGPLQLGSLTTCDGACDTDPGDDPTRLALLQSLTTQNGIELSSSVEIGGDGSRTLLANNGDITIGDEVRFRGGDLTIVAAQGDVEVGGRISTSADVAPFVPVDGPPPPGVAGGDVTIRGENLRLESVRTVGSTGETSGRIELEATAAPGEVELTGDFFTLDASASLQGTAGDITVTGSKLLIGSATEDVEITRVQLLGGTVMIDAEVAANRPPAEPLETSEGEDPVFAPLHARLLQVGADGDVSITGDVTIDALLIEGVPAQNLAGKPRSVTLNGTLNIGSEPDVEVIVPGLLRVDAQGPVSMRGNITARATQLFAAGELALGSDSDPAPIMIDSEVVSLRAGGSDPGTAEVLDLGNVMFVSTPERFEIEQEAGFTADDIAELITRIEGAPPGSQLAFRSTQGGVTANANDVNDTQLELTAAEGSEILVIGDLDVHTLDLGGNARVEGDVTVRFSRGTASRPAAGFRAAGDLDVQGDLTAYTVSRFDGGADDQSVTIGGDLSAPALERGRVPTSAGDGITATLEVEATGRPDSLLDSPISLLGSLGAREFSKNLFSANMGSGVSLVFKSDVVALGDVVADQNLDFQQRVSFTQQRVSFTEELEHGPVVGLDQNVEATEGTLTIHNSIDKSRGDLRLAGANFGIDDSLDAPGEQAGVRTTDDLTLSGSGVLSGDGELRKIQSTAGDVSIEGRLEFDGALEVEAGSGADEDRGTLDDNLIRIGAEGATLDAGLLELGSDIIGEGGLVLVADAVRFTSGAQEQRVEVASLELNPDGRPSVPTRATITREGDLTLIATQGAFEMGSGEKLTATGDLVISSAGRATISDLGAMTIQVRASSIGIAERAGGSVLLPDGGLVEDNGVDVVANRVDFSQTPDRDVTIATPTSGEISDALTGDRVLSRAIFPDLRKLRAQDFNCDGGLCDLVAQGSALVESSRLLEYAPPGEGPADYQLLGEVNVEGVSARPLWGQELLAYLERASTGGDRSDAEFDDPRLQLPPVQAALRIYRALFAPTEIYDDTSGARIARSHRERILEVLQQAEDDFLEQRSEPLTGENYLAYVATGTTHGEAMFYLSAIVDLTREASRAGVRGGDLRLFVLRLLEDVAPRQLGVESLAEAMPAR